METFIFAFMIIWIMISSAFVQVVKKEENGEGDGGEEEKVGGDGGDAAGEESMKREGNIEILPLDQADPTESKPPSERVTTKFMTKYERARVLGTRALQISMNGTSKMGRFRLKAMKLINFDVYYQRR